MKRFLIITLAVAVTVGLPQAAMAAGIIPDSLIRDPGSADYVDIRTILVTLIRYGFAFAAAIGMLFVVVAGYQYILSAGNPEKLEKAKMGLTWAIGGFILAISSYAIVLLLQNVLRSKQKLSSVPGITRPPQGAPSNAAGVIENIGLALFVLGGVAAIFYLTLGGYRYVTSQGNPEQIDMAKKSILYAVIGLIVVFISTGLIATVRSQLFSP